MGGAVSPQSASGERGGLTGDGTAGNPYQIATADDLLKFAKLVNDGETTAWAELTDDIDLSEICSEEDGVSWTPIGNSEENAYTGTFDGQNFKISGLYIKNTSSDTDDQGLFGYVSGTVKDLSVSGSVSGNDFVGGVVGWNFGGTVTGCAFSGSVKGSGPDSGRIYVGGVVGYNSFGTVTNCYNTGNVSVTSSDISNVGGVVGYNHGGRVENCYNTGDVTGGSYVGGVVGSSSGGISVSASVTNCYNTGEVSGSSDYSYIGGVVGNNDGTVTDCYFLQQGELPGIGDGSGKPSEENVKSLTAEEFADQSSFTNSSWDFANTWETKSIFGRPTLKDNAEIGGTANNPYKIFTATQLETFRDLVNDENGNPAAWAVLMNDIDLKDVCGPELNGGSSVFWIRIGNSFSNSYSGNFDGDGHTISGLTINSSSANNQGLFGYVGTGGTVQNLTVSGSVSVSDGEDVGGVVGYNFSGTVTNCAFSGSVSGNNYVGGIVGYNSSGTVENCYNTGTVSDGTTSGGVVGQNSGSVTNCYFLSSTAASGIGKNEGSGDATATEKDNTAFHSGEVAWRLQKGQADGEGGVVPLVWGQSNLTTDKSWPTLVALDKNENAKPVYKVTVVYGDYADAPETETSYTNNPAIPSETPSRDGYTFGGWDKTGEGTTTITYTAKWTENAPDPDPEPTPDPEPEEPPYTGKYSYEVFTSVGDNGTVTVDRYATEGDKVTIDVTPDEAYKLDDLSVTANGKEVELTANSDGTYSFTMPSADVKISATFAEDPDWTPDEPEEPTTDVSDIFVDIAPDAWYKDAIQYAYDNGLMTGVSDTEFAPEQTTTRAMIVSILARLEGVTTAEAAGFADVDDNDWYATAVNWAANVGVVNGYEDNTFQPNTAITREQLAAILMNYAAYKGYDVSARADLSHYSDADSISSWANDVLLWAVAEGLLTGVTDDTIAPQAHATRAQVAAILQRFLSE